MRESPVDSAPPPKVINVIRLPQSLDYGAVPNLQRLLEPLLASPEDVVLDMSDVSFMDCTGLGVLLRANAALAGRMRVANCPRSAEEEMILTGTDDSFTSFTVTE